MLLFAALCALPDSPPPPPSSDSQPESVTQALESDRLEVGRTLFLRDLGQTT